MIDLNNDDLNMIAAFVVIHTGFDGYFETVGENTFFLNWLINKEEGRWSFNWYDYDKGDLKQYWF